VGDRVKRIPPATVRAVWERDQGCCQWCGHGQTWERRGDPYGWSVQHRVKKSHGVNNTLPNLLVLCGGGTTGCHGTVEARPQIGYDLGLGLHSWDDPAVEPVRTFDQVRWATEDGRWSHEPPQADAA
jgi:5-methylcytosine-specific restriction endonuclease McrA